MPSTAPELAVCLTDDHWRSRKDALEQFMRLDEDAGKLVFNRLRATLSDGNLRVRRAGAHTLAGMCLPEVWGKKPANFAAQAVSESFHLADADPLVRKAAQEPLEELQKKAIVGDVVVAGQAALPSLKERLLDEDWQIRDATLRAMARLGVGALSCSKDIARLLTDDSAVCRDSAKSALDTMLGAGLAAADLKVVVPPNAELYVQRLKHQDPKVRCAACWVLGHSAAAVVNLHGIAEVLVKESNPKTLSLAAECIGAMQLAALPAAPEVAESLKSFMAQEGREKMRGIARSPAGAALMQLHKEVVAVIGRAITKDPRVKDAAERAQQYGARLGRETNLQREEGVKALMQPAHSHVAAVTELLRVILDPECPGAQAGMPSYLIAVGSLETFRENGLLGGFDLSRCDIIAELLEALEDSSWTVRLASAEALATLSCHIRPFLQCLRQHRKSDNNELKVAAQKLWQSIDAGKVWTHARVMSESAVKVMRGMINTTKSGELKDSDRHFVRSVTSALMQRMVEAGVIEKNDTKSHHPKHKGRILPNFNP